MAQRHRRFEKSTVSGGGSSIPTTANATGSGRPVDRSRARQKKHPTGGRYERGFGPSTQRTARRLPVLASGGGQQSLVYLDQVESRAKPFQTAVKRNRRDRGVFLRACEGCFMGDSSQYALIVCTGTGV